MSDVAFTVAPAGDIVVVDLWSDALPDFGDLHATLVEPRRWWLIDPGDTGALAAALAKDGTLYPIGGGLIQATLTGPGWRALLMVSGVFDAEDPNFGPGDCAATVVHHVSVWIAPVDRETCKVFFAASFAEGLVDFWTAAISRGLA